MPIYEMPVMIRSMARPNMVTTLKRISSVIFQQGGFIRKIDNLGVQPIPYKTRAHGKIFNEASYFIFHFDIPPSGVVDICDVYGRDLDIIRTRIFKREEIEEKPCTLHEEMLPPPYRPSVQKMVELAQIQSKKKTDFKYNSGLDYYPFQK